MMVLAKRKNDQSSDQSDRPDVRHVESLLGSVERIALADAATHAEDVDRNARFPKQTFEALREAAVLGAAIPVELGGTGCNVDELARMCTTLARSCASSAMILAMHHIQVLSILEHRGSVPELEDYLRQVAQEQRLIASATSEVGTGGDLGHSLACLEPKDDGFSFEKAASTISYGEIADDLLVTLRRGQKSASGDQVLVLVRKGDYTLRDVGVWDTLGMRGTCSPPATIQAKVAPWQILPTPFRNIASTTMVPASHLLWSAVWIGIATDAFDRARRVMQTRMRKDPDSGTLVAARLASVATTLHGMQSQLASVIRDHTQRMASGPSDREMGVAEALRVNDLKLAASQQVVEIVGQSIQVAGVAAYRDRGKTSLGRHLRDAHSAALMINNDRIREANADLLLVYKGQ